MIIIESILRGVEELSGVKLNDDDLVMARHPLITVLLAVAYLRENKLNSSQVASLFSLWSEVLELQLQIADGDKSAIKLYKGIEKLANPPKMLRNEKNQKPPFLPIVDDLLENYKSSEHLVRAYEVRRLMSELSNLVVPVCNCSKPKSYGELFSKPRNLDESFYNGTFTSSESLCECSVLKPRSKIILREKFFSLNEELIEEVNNFFEHAPNNVKSRLTLEGLAKKIYLHRKSLNDPAAKFSEREINRDMKHLQDYERKNPETLKNSHLLHVRDGEDLPYQFLVPIE